MSDALVLAGGVAKGAFSAGALSVLSDPETKARLGLDVSRIVGASSGALNGVFYAAAIRSGNEAFAGQRLAQFAASMVASSTTPPSATPSRVRRRSRGSSCSCRRLACAARRVIAALGNTPGSVVGSGA